ncbi:hypothetical protein ALC62_00698 [Cyphomyrmex costatus]|uniref:Uncharacterized protein n=1 Tax=Cyphomyrmex costatus TaxID=456900 RepID=A0A151IQ88_9HYME|nr:hypothetical protein ALC62_00698 [Cyphomyrmex costatus]
MAAAYDHSYHNAPAIRHCDVIAYYRSFISCSCVRILWNLRMRGIDPFRDPRSSVARVLAVVATDEKNGFRRRRVSSREDVRLVLFLYFRTEFLARFTLPCFFFSY